MSSEPEKQNEDHLSPWIKRKLPKKGYHVQRQTSEHDGHRKSYNKDNSSSQKLRQKDSLT